MRITEYLEADHLRLHELLAEATRAQRCEPGQFAQFREGLLRHIAIEEKLLMPAVRRARDGTGLPRAHELRMDHAALTSLLVPTPDLALCSELAGLLALHDQKEEGPGGVYAECERYLSPEQSQALAVQAAGFPAIRVVAHFDGQGVHRTAASALASAQRIKQTR